MVFDVGVGAHLSVQLDGVAFGVGVVAPEPILEIGQQRCLGAGVFRLTADDQPGVFRPVRQVNKIGDVTDLCGQAAVGGFDLAAVLVDGCLPPVRVFVRWSRSPPKPRSGNGRQPGIRYCVPAVLW